MKKKKLKAIVTIEIEIDNDIENKYPNYFWNYTSKNNFLKKEIARLEHNIKIEDSKFHTLHPAYKNKKYDYDFFDDGYSKKILDFKIVKE